MFCSKCGAENTRDAKFCVHCGSPIGAEDLASNSNQMNYQASESSAMINSHVTEMAVNSGGIRKALKADAKMRPKTPLVLATLVYFIICGVIGAFIVAISGVNYFDYADETTMPIWAELLEGFLTLIVGAIFAYGILSVSFDAVRGKKISFGDVFTRPFRDIKKLGYYLLLTLAVYIIGFVVGILVAALPVVGILLSIGFFVAAIYYGPVFDVFLCILTDENVPEESFVLAFKRALNVIKGHRVEYYGTNLSFFGWWLLSILTLGILFIWIIPYMRMTVVNMYRRWNGEVNVNANQTGLSNGAVIGLSVGGCGGCLIVFMIFFIGIVATVLVALGYNFEAISDYANDSVTTIEKTPKVSNNLETTIGSNSGSITFIVPNGFNSPYKGNNNYYSSFHTSDSLDTIRYFYISMAVDSAYSDEVERNAKYRNDNYQYNDNEFTTTINNQSIKVHTAKVTTTYDTFYTELFTAYPINSNNSVKITIKVYNKNITADNFKDYVIIK